ncbi:MAG TPA: hypothetical protein VM555_03725, partial [Tahibacter sp.]|nr:hypothetical protein [Tahibacter sp.]
AKTVAEMERIVFNQYVDAVLCALFLLVVLSVVVFGFLAAIKARRTDQPTAQETPYVALEPARA